MPGPPRWGRRGCRRCRTASWWRRIKISAVCHASSRRDSRSHVVIRVMRRKANRRHMTGDRDGQAAGKANPAGQSRGRAGGHRVPRQTGISPTLAPAGRTRAAVVSAADGGPARITGARTRRHGIDHPSIRRYPGGGACNTAIIWPGPQLPLRDNTLHAIPPRPETKIAARGPIIPGRPGSGVPAAQ